VTHPMAVLPVASGQCPRGHPKAGADPFTSESTGHFRARALSRGRSEANARRITFRETPFGFKEPSQRL